MRMLAIDMDGTGCIGVRSVSEYLKINRADVEDWRFQIKEITA